MQKRTRRRTAAQWDQLVREWEASGLPGPQFARRRGLSARQLSWWRWRLRSAGRGGAEPRLVRVEVGPVTPLAAGWEITTPGGHRLRVEGAASAEELRSVLSGILAAERGAS